MRKRSDEKTAIRSVAEAIGRCRAPLAWAALFGVAANLLLLAGPLYMLQVYDRVLASGSIETLVALTVIVVAAYGALGVIDYARTALVARAGLRLDDLLGERLMRDALSSRREGEEGSLADLDRVRGFVGGPGALAVFDLPFAPFFALVITLIHPWLGLLSVVAMLSLLALAALSRLARRIAARGAPTGGGVRYAQKIAPAAEAYRALGAQAPLTARWRALRDADLLQSRRAGDVEAGFRGAAKSVRFTVQSLCLGLGALLVIQNEMTAGGMIAASIILGRALAPIELAFSAWAQLDAVRASWRALNDALARTAPGETDASTLDHGAVAFERLSYAPLGAKEPLLPELNLAVPAGALVGVVGPSGVGKSTLARLLVGALEPSRGVLRFDGFDRRSFDPDRLGARLGYLGHEPVFAPGTVAENIARLQQGREEEAVAAAEAAGAHRAIQQLPQGYATRIGEGGAPLSAGQVRRVALARAFFGAPQVLILDEPACGLDEEGEQALTNAVEARRAAGATVLWFSQRLRHLESADFLLALTPRRQALFGPPDAVLSRLRGAAAGKDSSLNGVRRIA